MAPRQAEPGDPGCPRLRPASHMDPRAPPRPPPPCSTIRPPRPGPAPKWHRFWSAPRRSAAFTARARRQGGLRRPERQGQLGAGRMVVSAIVFLGNRPGHPRACARARDVDRRQRRGAAPRDARQRHPDAQHGRGARVAPRADVEWERRERQLQSAPESRGGSCGSRVGRPSGVQGVPDAAQARRTAEREEADQINRRGVAQDHLRGIDAQIEAYGDEMSDLNQRYMTKTKDEARRSRSRSRPSAARSGRWRRRRAKRWRASTGPPGTRRPRRRTTTSARRSSTSSTGPRTSRWRT